MPKIAGDPLTKVTLNLYESDVNWFRKRYGQGYSTFIRDMIRRHRCDVLHAEHEIDRSEHDWLGQGK